MEYHQNQNVGMMPVKDNKVLAIVALILSILCCNIISIVLAIIAVVKSNDATKYQLRGLEAQAELSGRRAGLFAWLSIGLMALGVILQFVWLFVMGGMEVYQQMLQNMQ